MHSTPHPTSALPRLTAAALLLFMAAGVSAQQVYRNVDKNGKVTFSDRAPTASAEAAAPPPGITAPANAGLPYELRQVVQRYPVTLYSGDDCAPCSTARSLLTSRGVPFDERTVKTNDEVDALQRLSGQNGLPLLTIGAQQLKGFSDVEWSQYLDAAGYPKSNSLPAGYRNGPARPLVAVTPAAAPRAGAPAAPAPAPTPAATPSDPGAGNPAGIKF